MVELLIIKDWIPGIAVHADLRGLVFGDVLFWVWLKSFLLLP